MNTDKHTHRNKVSKHFFLSVTPRLGLVSVLAMLLSCFSTTVHADDNVPALNDSSYYEISTAEQLKWFADKVNAGDQSINGVLTADIDLSGLGEDYWTPIGLWSEEGKFSSYKGKFNGQNHTVTGLVLRKAGASGLFGAAEGAAISNVIVSNAQMKVTPDTRVNKIQDGIGTICGIATKGTVISNCHSTLTEILYKHYNETDQQDINWVGGIVGQLQNSTVRDCTVDGFVRTDGVCVGGIAGGVIAGLVENCHLKDYDGGNSAVVGENNVGGIAGFLRGRTMENAIVDCTVADESVVNATQGTSATVCGVDTLFAEAEEFGGYYEIYTADQLKWFSSKVNGGSTTIKGKLMNDLNMSKAGTLTPIGSDSNPFAGEFDGQEFTIDSLTIASQKYAGLFGYVKDGAIKNLYLTNPTLKTTDNDYQGLFVGWLTQNPGHATVVGYIENCHVRDGNLERDGSGEPQYVGGIVGKVDMSAEVRGCSFQGIVKAHEDYIGGIAGCMDSGAKMYDCTTIGPSTVWGDDYVGGVVGYMTDTDTKIDNCFANQDNGVITVHAEGCGYKGLIRGYDKSGSVTNTKYNEGGLQYELTGKKITVEDGKTANETHITGVSTQNQGTYYACVDIGSSGSNYFNTVIENLYGVEELYFWDNCSNLAGTKACNWIDMTIADRAFDSNFKSLKMYYRMFAGDDHDVMLRPTDVRPTGDKMFANCPDAKVYVDAEYYEEFLADSLWSKYKDHIVPVTSMRGVDLKQEGTYYAYDRNRDRIGSMVVKSPDGKHNVRQLHIVGGEDKSELRVYKDIGQDHDYNTTKIWAGTFRGRQNLQTVRFSEIIEAAYHTYGPMQITLGDSCFADCPKLGHFEVILYSNEGDDHVEYIHPNEMPIGKGVFDNSPNVKIFVARELLDEFKNDTEYGWAAYKDRIYAGDFGNNDFDCKGVWYSYYTSADGQTQYTNSDNDAMEKMLSSWSTEYRGFSPYKILEYGNSATIRYVSAKGVVASEIEANKGELRLYCDIGGYHNYKTLALSGNGFQGQTCIQNIVFEDCYSDRGNAKTGLSLVIPDYTFKDCKNLKELSLFYYVTEGTNHYEAIKPSQIFIGEHVFDGVDSTFCIRVSPEYYYDFITDPNWSQYKDRILAAEYMPVDKDPITYEGVTYDYASKSLNSTDSGEIMRMQASLINIPIVAIEVYLAVQTISNMISAKAAKAAAKKALEVAVKNGRDVMSGAVTYEQVNTGVQIVTQIGNRVVTYLPEMTEAQYAQYIILEALSKIMTPSTLTTLANYTIATLLTAMTSSAASLTDEVAMSRLQNYILNRQVKRFTKDPSWMVSGLNWVSTRQRTNIDNMYVKSVDDQETVTIGANPTVYDYWTALFEQTKDYQTVAIGKNAFHNKSKLREVKFRHSNNFARDPLFGFNLVIPDSCFAGCDSLRTIDLIIKTRSYDVDSLVCYKALTPDNFTLLGDMFAGISEEQRKNIKIRIGKDVLQDFLEDEMWAQYKDMFDTTTVADPQIATEWGCQYTYTFDQNTMMLKTQVGNEDVMHVDIFAPNNEQLKNKDGLAALVGDIGAAYSYKLDHVKPNAFKGNELLKTLDVTDLTGNVGDQVYGFSVALQDSAFAHCKNFENLNLIFQVTDGSNHTESLSPGQIGLGRGVFDDCDKLRIKFCLDQEDEFNTNLSWLQYADKYAPCFFEPLDEKVFDILKDKGYCFKTALVNKDFDHIDATKAKPEDLKTLFKGTDIESFDEFRAFSTCGLKKIYDSMFEGCSSLQTIMLPDSVRSIGANAFKDCGLLYKLVIPEKVDTISSSAFTGSGIKEFIFENTVPVDVDVTTLFAGLDSTYVIYVTDSLVNTYKTKWAAVANHINGLSERQSSIKTVVLTEPGTLAQALGCTYTYDSDAEIKGNYAQYEGLRIIGPIDGRDIGVLRIMGGCDVEHHNKTIGRLKYLDLYEANIKKGYDYDRYHFNHSVNHDDYVESMMFSYLDKIETLILPKTLKRIETIGLSDMENLRTLVVGDETKEIGFNVIQDSENLSTLVMLPSKVPSTENVTWAMKDKVFGIGGTDNHIGTTYVPAEAVNDYQIPSFIAYTDSIAIPFKDAVLAEVLKKSHVFIPTDLLRVRDLTGVVSGSDVQTFNELYYCAAATLGNNSLTGMKHLAEVTLPYRLENITTDAFKGCNSLGTIYSNNMTPAKLEAKAFDDLPPNFVVYVPEGCVETYRKAWPEYASHIWGYRSEPYEQVSVCLEKPNTLAEKLGFTLKRSGKFVSSVSGGNIGSIKSLKVSGPIGGEDIAVIRMLGGRDPFYSDIVYTTNLKYLDLYDAQIKKDSTDIYFAYYRAHLINDMEIGLKYKIDNDNEVPEDMLWGCNNLETVILPKTATKICDEACYDMYSLKTLVIGDDTNDVDGNDAFGDCDKLTKMIFLSTKKPELNHDAFTDPVEGDNFKVKNIYVRKSILNDYLKDEQYYGHAHKISSAFDDEELFRALGTHAVVSEDDLQYVDSVKSWFDAFPEVKDLSPLGKTSITKIDDTTVSPLKGLQHIMLPATMKTIAPKTFKENGNLRWIDLAACDSLTTDVSTIEFNRNAILYAPEISGSVGCANVVYTNDGNLECADYWLTDTLGYDVPKAFTAKKITFGRKFPQDTYTSLTLPFSLPNRPVGFELYALNTDSTRNGRLFFSPVANMVADMPYVVKTKNRTLEIDAETAVPVTPVRNTSVRGAGYTIFGNIQTIGTKDAKDQKMLVMNETDRLWNLVKDGDKALLPFTAYVQTNNNSTTTTDVSSTFTDCLYHYYIGDTPYDIYGNGTSEHPLFADSVMLVDGLDFSADKPFATDTATYSRAMTATWGTLCLPYAIEADSNETCEFYEMTGKSDNAVTLAKLTGIVEAGRPVMVRRRNGVETVVINASEDVKVVDKAVENDDMTGTFSQTEVPDGAYIISKDKFWLVGSSAVNKAKVNAYRSYISSSTGAKATTLSITTDDETTAIDELNNMEDGNAEYYDAEGRRLDGLQRGLNIVKNGNRTIKVMIQ